MVRELQAPQRSYHYCGRQDHQDYTKVVRTRGKGFSRASAPFLCGGAAAGAAVAVRRINARIADATCHARN